MIDLGTLPGDADSFAVQINLQGQVAGYSCSGGCHAFAWNERRGMIDLGTLGGTSSFVYAMNQKGEIAGTSDMPGDTAFHGVMWQPR